MKNLIGPAGKGSEVGDAGLGVWLNDAYFQIVAEINDVIPDYFTKKSTTDLIDSQKEYELPSDFDTLLLCSVSFDGTNFYKATPLNNLSQDSQLTTNQSIEFQQNMPFYYISNNYIGIAPTPSSTVTNSLIIWYTYTPSSLDEDSDVPAIPEKLQRILKYSMYANYLDQNDEHAAAEVMRRRFDSMAEKIILSMSRQQIDQPRTVEVVEDDMGLYVGDYE